MHTGSKIADKARPGILSDIQHAAESIEAPGWVFAASADYCLQPGFPLQRFVEAALVSNRLTIAMAQTFAAEDSAGAFAQLPPGAAYSSKQMPGGHAFKLASLSMEPPAADCTAQVLRTLPTVAIPPATLDTLAAHAADAAAASWQSLQCAVAAYSAEQPVTGFALPAAFSLRTLRRLLFADRFFVHWDLRVQEAYAVRSCSM